MKKLPHHNTNIFVKHDDREIYIFINNFKIYYRDNKREQDENEIIVYVVDENSTGGRQCDRTLSI